MRSAILLFALPGLCILFNGTFGSLAPSAHSLAEISPEQSALEKREAAYRANNLGVAHLEQYRAKEAVESFQRALERASGHWS